ncbi:MAG: bifunctional enoyl-CoA hydratase/phosphate acetyltransferase [Tissierellia bacterium]|nr:bifunctional enoyl-CoA hydratase/phosphate acetyltransferase [Tissierellia bacterium]
MVIKNFDELLERLRGQASVRRVALVAAEDIHALEALIDANKEGLVEPLLIGDEKRIRELLLELNCDASFEILDEKVPEEAAKMAVELAREGRVDFLMKGAIETSGLLRAVVDKEKGLGQGRLMSHFVMMEIPSYHKLFVTTDGGMVMYPGLVEKKEILLNALDTLWAMGYKEPKVAVLAAVEKLNPKMPETVDAAALKEMYLKGEIKDCIIEGPISYDLAMNRESSEIKGYSSPVAGDPDLLLVPNIAVGNIMSKALIYSAGGKMAGIVVGAKVPIVLTSRGSSAEEKFLSLALAALSSERS